MNKIRLGVRGATVVVCAGLLAAGFLACSDNGEPAKTDDAGGGGAGGSGGTAGAGGSGGSGGTAGAGGSGGSGGHDASSEDSPVTDSTVEAAPEATVCPKLNLCDAFDQIFGIADGGEPSSCATETNGNCPARGTGWDVPIVQAFGGGPAFTDCRVNSLFTESDGGGGLLSSDAFNDYTSNQLEAYVFDFLGCPVTGGDAGTDGGTIPPFGVIPAALAGDVFTTADISLLSSDWLQAIEAAVAGAGGSVSTLTAAQISAIKAELACEASMESGIVKSSKYNYSTCSDGGPDSGSD
jgi:hypothetical protein